MRKGIILEVNDLYVTLLTPEGEFMRTRKLRQDYPLGGEIQFFPMELGKNSKREKAMSFLKMLSNGKAGALIAAVILLLAFSVPLYQSGHVYAYMSIDVNPSVEMGLNEKLEVINIKAYNKDGEAILSGLKGWKKQDASTVANLVLTEIKEQGYMKKNKDVLIAAVPTEDGKPGKKLQTALKEIKAATEDENIEVTVLSATEKERKMAKQQGLTPGLYKEKQLDKHKQKPVKANHGKAKHPVKEEKPHANGKPASKESLGYSGSSENVTAPATNGENNKPKQNENGARRPETSKPATNLPPVKGNKDQNKNSNRPPSNGNQGQNRLIQPNGQEQTPRESDKKKPDKGPGGNKVESDVPRPEQPEKVVNADKPGNGYGRDKAKNGNGNGKDKEKNASGKKDKKRNSHKNKNNRWDWRFEY
ncbi:hypothetical protein [Mesobacillus zeae]|uniref:RsgI N-terminal anti-sigma domain-containing protein n=1 Tax=Mesobacillus zeae TaxID=1917180 RepID=A0A398BDA0_9BACI|nr:hypothetical protein [Mesobacillus zeae]RID87787.1 hypothetical protein D1970_02780 [Mesobacillus zeae]